MTRIIKVEPFGKDWKVRSDRLDEDMMFATSAAAEAAARLLADAFAKAGQGGEIQIHDQHGALAGRLAFAPPRASRSRRVSAGETLAPGPA